MECNRQPSNWKKEVNLRGFQKDLGEKKKACFLVGKKTITCPLRPLLENKHFQPLLAHGSHEIKIEKDSYATFARIIEAIANNITPTPKDLSLQEWVDLTHAANYYQVDLLKKPCEQALIEHASKDVEESELANLTLAAYTAKSEKAFIVCAKAQPPVPAIFFTLARKGDTEWMAHLFEAVSINVNAQNKDGKSALHVAIGEKQVDMVEWLLNKGASIDLRGGAKETPLHIATSLKREERIPLLKLLLTKKGDLNVTDFNDNTPLHRACLRRNQEAILMLVKSKATLLLFNNNGQQPLHIPSEQGDKEYIEKLFRALVKEKLEKGKKEALIWAAFRQTEGPQSAYYDLVSYLIDEGANVNVTNKRGETPLCKTAQYGLVAPTAFLLNRQAKVNVFDCHNQTPLHKAAQGGHPKIVKKLVENGADIDVWDDKGRTPAQLAHEQREKGGRYEDYTQVIGILEKTGCPIQ